MDLRRLRTFVAVAELGTVSKAALRLRIGQPALSRQISDLQRELGLRLFDRVGRGLVLTAEGEQFLGDCRTVLGHVDVLGERVEVLRRGDRGVLKVAAPPQTIESVLSTFLPRYAERFPNVHVKLTEALGRDQTPMLERGEVHIGIRHDPGDPRFESLVLPADEVLAACTPSLELGHAGTIDIGRLASYPLLLLDSGYSIRRLFNGGLPSRRCRAKHCAREPRAAYLARARRGRPGRGDHSVDPANGSPSTEDRPRNPSAQAGSGTICYSVG
jgi:LysR family nitrogen assimilation transcriptional regulator